ncbi:hypothetical protein PIB30_052730 [Stylosanthes scabra]|uniref:Uncharacterized protein n=1 Tax=Stylosanthes scabra TaxID=79078 RepID=A0ABU6SIK1_9FABA|nr:hypothetical protein [Stylosanthes scabra]
MEGNSDEQYGRWRATDAGSGHQQARLKPPCGGSDKIPAMWDNGSGIRVEIYWNGWNWELITENDGGNLIRTHGRSWLVVWFLTRHRRIVWFRTFERQDSVVPYRCAPLTTTCHWFSHWLRGGDRNTQFPPVVGGVHDYVACTDVLAGYSELVRDRDLGDGPGIFRRTSPGRRGEELRWGEAELAEAASTDDSEGRRPAGCPVAVCPLLHHDDYRKRLVPRQDQQHRLAEVGPAAAGL